jgi:hypothetical protein
LVLLPLIPSTAWANTGSGGAVGVLYWLAAFLALVLFTALGGGYRVMDLLEPNKRWRTERLLLLVFIAWALFVIVLIAGGEASFGFADLSGPFLVLMGAVLVFRRGKAMVKASRRISSTGAEIAADTMPGPARLGASGALLILLAAAGGLLALFTAVTAGRTPDYRVRAYDSLARSDLKKLILVQEQYHEKHGRYAADLASLSESFTPGEDIQVRIRSADDRQWTGIVWHLRSKNLIEYHPDQGGISAPRPRDKDADSSSGSSP